MSEELARITNRSQQEIEQSIVIKSRSMTRMLMAAVCDIGLDLTDLRATCPHGEWGATLKRLGYTKSLANNWMMIYKAYGTKQVSLFPGENVQTFGTLSPSKALALIAIPAEDRESFAKDVDAENISVRALNQKIQEYKQAEEESKNRESGYIQKIAVRESERDAAKEAADKALQDLEKALERIKELEAAPAKVEIQTVDASEEQIRAAEQRGADSMRRAVDEFQQTNSGLAKQVEDLQEQLRKAEQRAQDASSEEVEALREKLTNVEKQLSEAKQGGNSGDAQNLLRVKIVAQAQEKVSNIQHNVTALITCLDELDEITAAKLKKTVAVFLHQQAQKLEA